MNMDELDEIEMLDSLSENDGNSSDEKIQKNYTNKNIKHKKQSIELSQEDFNNKIIQAFKSEEVKETFTSIFESTFISGKTSLNRKKQLKRTDTVIEDPIIEPEIEIEKENINGEKIKIKKLKNIKKSPKKKNNKNQRSKTIVKNKEKIPNKFTLKDENGNIKYYIFHRKNKDFFDLRCRDRKCKETARYDIDKDEISINKECSIKNYHDHNYANKSYINKKIEINEIDEEDMNNELYQAKYFKFMHINYPTLMYNDILLILSEKYNPNKIYYSLKKFNNFKNNYTKAKQNNIKNEK